MDFSIGAQSYGFTIESIKPVEEFDGTAYIMRHAKSGARLMYLATNDENMAFSISFKTPPSDSTGVFHILEHSVLCGSKKFPVKEPFVNLLKSSMQTFLNAMTFPDKTMYPVASTNEQDLLNLVDVYMDAVLNPRIYDKRAIFEQEGWHYELDDADSPLRYNGVVFNEMKGALSNPDSVLYNALCSGLFPDTAYAFESGGDPVAIPNLTYEHFLDTHKNHYRLDNSYIILYGDMNLDRMLAFLNDNYLDVCKPSGRGPNPLEMQDPVINMDIIKPMQTAAENACIGLGYVVGTAAQRERMLAIDILVNTLMSSNESPLKRALLDSGLSDDVHGFLVDEQLQPIVVLELKGSKPDAKDRFLEVVRETVEDLQKTGIPKEKLHASLARAEFAIRERDFGAADGVVLAISSLTGWLYDDEAATDYLQYEKAFEEMRNNIDSGYFEELLREVFLECNHTACAEIKPVEQLEGEQESEKLAGIKASLSDQEIETILDEGKVLQRLQEEPDSPEALATLPLLRIEDIGEIRKEPQYQILEDTPITCLYHNIPSRHINYTYHYFDLCRVAFEDLAYVGVLMRLLGKLDTAMHTAEEIDNLAQTNLGVLRYFVEMYSEENDASIVLPKFVVSSSALAENMQVLATLPAEIWSSTIFENTGRIKEILQQSRIALEQDFATAGHSAALSRASSYYTPAALIREAVTGVDFYRFLKQLLADFNTKAPELVTKLYQITHQLFSQEDTVTSFTGTPTERNKFWDVAQTLTLPASGSKKQLVIPPLEIRNEAFIVPTDVCYAAKGYDRRLLKKPYTGSWQVASRMLSFDYLWSNVRVKGGAYGCGFKADRSGALQYYSYRDPNLDSTLDIFNQAGSWLDSYTPDDDAFTGYIISSVAGYDAPKKPRELARRKDAEYFGKLDPTWREQARTEVLETTPNIIKGLAPTLDEVAKQQIHCVFGSREILEKSNVEFDIIDLLA